MELSLYILSFLSFAYVCILPFIFFRKDGTWNIMWCLTALPYTAYIILISLAYFGKLAPIYDSSLLQTLSTPLFVLSIAIISLTIGVHRVPLSLWHQKNDAPVNIVKHGPYSKIRHPFYTSFILALIGGAMLIPHVISFLITILAILLLNHTANKEEIKLSSSDFGQEYKDYIKVTGRFTPFF